MGIKKYTYEDYDDKYRVSTNFYCGYVNRRGIRSVGDGSVELSLSEKFGQYRNYYQYSHAVVSRVLDSFVMFFGVSF